MTFVVWSVDAVRFIAVTKIERKKIHVKYHSNVIQHRLNQLSASI